MAIRGGREISWQQKSRVVVIWLLALVCVFSQATRTQAKQEPVEVWVQENYKAVVNLISQEKGCTAAEGARPGPWSVCVGVIPGHQIEPEYLLLLEKQYDGKVHARATRPQGASIYMQLLKLKRERPNASAAQLAKLIAVEIREGDLQTVPALARLADKFEKIQLSPALSDEVMMDPTRYSIHAESASGERIELLLCGPGPSAAHQPRPLLEWVEELRRVLSSQ